MLIQLLSGLAPAAKEHANTLCAILASLSLAQLFALLWARNARRQPAAVASPEAHLRNLRRVGVRRSNMADQYDATFTIPEDAAGDRSRTEGYAGRRPRVKALFLHPVKSCAPVEVGSAVLLKRGFEHDRCFALAVQKRPKPGKGHADGEGDAEWRFVSQRTKPMMARIATELWFPRRGDAAGEDDRDGDDLVRAGGCVVLRFQDPDAPDDASATDDVSSRTTTKPSSLVPAMISLTVPLRPTAEMLHAHGIKRKPFGIHDRTAMGLDMSPLPSVASALPKLKRFLKLPEHHGLALLSCNGTASDPDGNDEDEDAMLSRTSGNLAPLRHIGTPSVHGYTDDQPLNVNSLASVHAVSALLPPSSVRPLNALRFRANVWVAGSPAFDEETWKRFRFVPTGDDDNDDDEGGGRSRRRVCATISAVCRTSRCTMPNVDPDRGVMCAGDPPPGRRKGRPQPSATLVEHRSVDDGNRGALGFLGMHCVPEDRSLAEAAAAAAAAGERGGRAGLVVRVGDEVEVLERGTHLFGSTANEY